MIKVRPWNGKALKGTWKVTIKIDGVRALWKGDHWESRATKPLYNIPTPPEGITDCEVYLGSLRDSVRAVRTQHLKPDTPRVDITHLHSLDPLDPRLACRVYEAPTPEEIIELMDHVILQGYEGLVLRQGDRWLKVKPSENLDVLVLGMVEGTGKHAGRLGAVQTIKGDVGTGFTDPEREWMWNDKDEWIGRTIEVACMHLTPDGMFRHPRYVRERFDKIAEE